MKNNAEQALKSVEHHREVLAKSKDLLAELNPAFKEKQQYEQRMANMEKTIEGLKDMMQNFIKEAKG